MRDIVLIFLAVFLVVLYLAREWLNYTWVNESNVQVVERFDSDLKSVTSAAKEDKQRDYDEKAVSSSNRQPSTAAPTSGETKQVLGLKIDINKATEQDFESLPGIGPKLSKEIIQKRKELGGFKTIDDMKKVRGIGEKKFEKIKGLIEIG